MSVIVGVFPPKSIDTTARGREPARKTDALLEVTGVDAICPASFVDSKLTTQQGSRTRDGERAVSPHNFHHNNYLITLPVQGGMSAVQEKNGAH